MNIESNISALVKTRYNVVTGLVESAKGKTFSPMDDRELKSLLRELKNQGHSVSIQSLRNILSSDFSPQFDPFESYFSSLPAWDKKDRIKEITSIAKVENNRYWEPWVTKWLVATVASLLDPEVVNHQVLVLAGKQGIGKTTWLEYLIPKELKAYLYSGNINPGNKDSLIHSSECMMVNMDELATLSNGNLESLKQLITQKHIRVRKPYGLTPENLPRRASFCGSTNEEQFLSDVSGNRRFLCFTVLDFDLDNLATIDVKQLYAQLLELYMNNFLHWFNKAEIALIEENNKKYLKRSMEEEVILEYFIPASEDKYDFKWSATQVMDYLAGEKKLYKSPNTAQSVGKALTKLGYIRKKTNGSIKYLLNKKRKKLSLEAA